MNRYIAILLTLLTNVKILVIVYVFGWTFTGEYALSFSIAALITLVLPRLNDIYDNLRIYHDSARITIGPIIRIAIIGILLAFIVSGILVSVSLISKLQFYLIVLNTIALVLNPLLNSWVKFEDLQLELSLSTFSLNILCLIFFFILKDSEYAVLFMVLPASLLPIIILFYQVFLGGGKPVALSVSSAFHYWKNSLVFNLAKYFGDQGIILLTSSVVDANTLGQLSLIKTFTMPIRVGQTYVQNEVFTKGLAVSKRDIRDWVLLLILTTTSLVALIIYWTIIMNEHISKFLLFYWMGLVLNFALMFMRLDIDYIINSKSLFSLRNISAIVKILVQLLIVAIFPGPLAVAFGLCLATLVQMRTFDRKIRKLIN